MTTLALINIGEKMFLCMMQIERRKIIGTGGLHFRTVLAVRTQHNPSYLPLRMSEHPEKNLSDQREQARNACHSKVGLGFKPVTHGIIVC